MCCVCVCICYLLRQFSTDFYKLHEYKSHLYFVIKLVIILSLNLIHILYKLSFTLNPFALCNISHQSGIILDIFLFSFFRIFIIFYWDPFNQLKIRRAVCICTILLTLKSMSKHKGLSKSKYFRCVTLCSFGIEKFNFGDFDFAQKCIQTN